MNRYGSQSSEISTEGKICTGSRQLKESVEKIDEARWRFKSADFAIVMGLFALANGDPVPVLLVWHGPCIKSIGFRP